MPNSKELSLITFRGATSLIISEAALLPSFTNHEAALIAFGDATSINFSDSAFIEEAYPILLKLHFQKLW